MGEVKAVTRGTLVPLAACTEAGGNLSSLVTQSLPISTKFESIRHRQRGCPHMPVYTNSGYLSRGTQAVYEDGVGRKGCLGNPEFMMGLHHISFSVLFGLIAGLLSTSTICWQHPTVWRSREEETCFPEGSGSLEVGLTPRPGLWLYHKTPILST